MAWLVHNNPIAFDPNRLYRITVVARQTAGAGTAFFGWAGVLSDKVTLCNNTGANSQSSQHYHAATAVDIPTGWTTYVGYTKGTAEPGTGNVGTMSNPAKMHTNVRYVRPLILVNYNGAVGITEINSFVVEDVTDAQAISAAVQTLATTVAGPDGATAQYTVKVDANGYVTGFGLSSTNRNGTPTSDFMVVADKFTIAPVATNPAADDGSPFYHLTVPTIIDGVAVPAGTYMKTAFIADASINNAKIGSLSADKITTGTLAAGRIATNSITADKINGTNLAVVNGTFSGNLQGATGSFSGALAAATGTFGGSLLAGVLDMSSFAGESHIFDTPGTYYLTVPSGKTSVRVTLVGAGGGGGGGGARSLTYLVSGGGGGGGGGGTVVSGTYTLTAGSVITLVVGGGGAGGAPMYFGGGHGGVGGATTVSGAIYLSASGGGGGIGGSTGGE